MKNNDISKVDLPDFLPQLPEDFTYKKTNLFYLPSFSEDINDDIDVLKDSENLYKLEKVFFDAMKNQEGESSNDEKPVIKDNKSVIPNKAVYFTHHNTLNNEYFINNLPFLKANKNVNTTKDVDILRVVGNRQKMYKSIESKKSKRENNLKRNVFIHQLQSNNLGNFDIKLPENKFSKENYIKMDKLRTKKINKFKENELAWQQMKYDIFKRLEEEHRLRKELEMEEKRLKEMEELRRRQEQEAFSRPQYVESEDDNQNDQKQTKMVFKLSPVENPIEPALKRIRLSFGGKPINSIVKEEAKADHEGLNHNERWVTLKCSPDILKKFPN
ncbi:hypothetical protein ACO0OE_000393 [Hanseniaspora uvarum]